MIGICVNKGMITIYSWKPLYFPSWLFILALLSPYFFLSSFPFLCFSSCLILASSLPFLSFFSLYFFLCVSAGTLIVNARGLFLNWQLNCQCEFPVLWFIFIQSCFGRISNCIYKIGENEPINLLCLLILTFSLALFLQTLFFSLSFSEIDFENRLWY